MLLAIDAGNTNIVLGCIHSNQIRCTARMATVRTRTEDEYAMILLQLLGLRHISPQDIDGAIISSVVPELKSVLVRAVELLCGVTPLIVGTGIKSGLNIKIDNPAQLGSDLVVGAIGAMGKYPKPLIVLDFGTATTLSVIDAKGAYRGGMIIPGMVVAVEALTSHTAQLPHIDLTPPTKVICSNTVDCMNAGVIYGNAAMLDGLIDRVADELGEPIQSVVGTGGLISKVAPYCKHKISVEDDLMLWGLKLIYDKNR